MDELMCEGCGRNAVTTEGRFSCDSCIAQLDAAHERAMAKQATKKTAVKCAAVIDKKIPGRVYVASRKPCKANAKLGSRYCAAHQPYGA
jgi:predicted amidophosphoribosyltransferase